MVQDTALLHLRRFSLVMCSFKFAPGLHGDADAKPATQFRHVARIAFVHSAGCNSMFPLCPFFHFHK